MHSAFSYDRYLLKRQVFALTGKLRFYNPQGQLVLFCEQRMFKLREDIRLYADEQKKQEVLSIKARQILDFSAAYDVVDTTSNEKVGALRRKGLQSMLRDEWQVLDANDRQIGLLFEDDMVLALVRRLVLGIFLPQNYDLTIGTARAADLKQRFNLLRYEMDIDFRLPGSPNLDPRLGLAAATLVAIIEGRQS
ncbi:MAG: hypothetical protein DDG60_04475 [Anaerolineae bacterium]|nr:MAG: hypothetical protein DDG60_04475 [Anaerolineae bacterium]